MFYKNINNKEIYKSINMNINNVNNMNMNINNNLNNKLKEITIKRDEYGLKQNLFDPTKMSPPNNFINKLRERMDIYN
jgi:hypothetical protein